MNCVYARQALNSATYEYLQKPEDFKDTPEGVKYYKNIVFFTNPTESEELFYVHSVGYEISPPDKSIQNQSHPSRTVFYYVIGGEGYFDGKITRRGDCIIAENGRPHSISARGTKDFVFCWISLAHHKDFSISALGFDKEKRYLKYGNFETELRQAIYSLQNFNPKIRDPYFFPLGKFFEILSYHKASDANETTEKSSLSHERYISLTKDMLEESRYKISIEEIAKAIGFSRKYLSMIFCQSTGITLRDYITQKKIERAKSMLIDGEASLKTIAFQLNYNDYSSFSRAFKKESGLTPLEYISKHKSKTGGA